MHITGLTGRTQDNVNYYSKIFPKSSNNQSIFSHHAASLAKTELNHSKSAIGFPREFITYVKSSGIEY